MAQRTATRTAVGRPRGRTSDTTRSRVLAAARTEFTARGYAGASVRRVAAAAGVSLPTVYHHFDSKAQLFVDAYRAADQQLLEALEQATASSQSFVERLGAMVDAARRLHAVDPTVTGILAVGQIERARSSELTHVAGSAGRAVPELVGRVVADAARSGELAPAVDPSAVARLIEATTLGVALYASLSGADGADPIFTAWRALMTSSLLR